MDKNRTNRANTIPAGLIAPCGMNCRLCRACLRPKNPCPGCRGDDNLKVKTRAGCKIKTCEFISSGNHRHCTGCKGFPCAILSRLDDRYARNYGMSMIDNLGRIKELGIRRFVQNEKEKWACPECGELLCVHEPQCLYCGQKWR
jgi:hypothetical protein